MAKLLLTTELDLVLALHISWILARSRTHFKTVKVMSSPANRMALNVVGLRQGPRTSRMVRGEGAVQQGAMTWKWSAGLMICPYLVSLTIPGGAYRPAAVTDLWPVTFLLAGRVSILAAGLDMAAEFSLAGAELRLPSGPSSRPSGREGG